MKSLIYIVLVTALLTLSTESILAQGYQKGTTYIGPTLGYGLGTGFGGSLEYGATDNIGIGLDLASESFTEEQSYAYIGTWKTDYSLFAGLLAATYHFSPGQKFDSFTKVGIGYFNWDFTISGGNSSVNFDPAYSSGFGYTGQVGFRYHFSRVASLRMSVGYPYYFSGGIDFSVGGN